MGAQHLTNTRRRRSCSGCRASSVDPLWVAARVALDPPRGRGTALPIAPEVGPGAGAQPFPSCRFSKWKCSSKTNPSKTGPCLGHLPREQPRPRAVRVSSPTTGPTHTRVPPGRPREERVPDDAVSLYPGPPGRSTQNRHGRSPCSPRGPLCPSVLAPAAKDHGLLSQPSPPPAAAVLDWTGGPSTVTQNTQTQNGAPFTTGRAL